MNVMTTLSDRQTEIIRKINHDACPSDWQDWRWQCINAIRSIDTFENLMDIRFGREERAMLDKTLTEFPFAITPYYLSLIDRDDFRNAPIFKQGFCSSEDKRKVGDRDFIPHKSASAAHNRRSHRYA